MDANISSVATECDATTRSGASQNEFITLGQARQIAPGRPSASCIWRWCRKGVQCRSGDRIKLKHVRGGGKLYTTAQWVREFTLSLAEADTAYFEQRENDSAATAAECKPERDRRLNQIDRELKEAGL